MSDRNLTSDLDAIFNPRGIAVIGATGDPGKLGHQVTKGFVDIGVCKNIYPVNPNPRPVLGYEAYPSVAGIPGDVDLAVIVVPPAGVPAAITDCAAKGVRGAIIFSSVISEDPALEREVIETAKRGGTRLIGPDSMGIYSPAGGLALFPDMPRQSGSVAFVSHSGAIAFMVSMYGTGRGLGFSKVVDCGNECDLTFADYLEYLESDPATGIIAGYIEGAKDGGRFLEAARGLSLSKPVILIKSGVTPRSEGVVASHTGALAGSPAVWDTVFRQAGLVRVEGIDELIDCLLMFRMLPPPAGDRVALISGTGGPLVMATDLCVRAGLEVPVLSDATAKKLRAFLPPYGTSAWNPVDLSIAAGVKSELHAQAIEVLGGSDEVDILLVIAAGEWRGEEAAESIVAASRGIGKPLLAVLPGNPARTSAPMGKLVAAGIPAFPSLERAVKHLAAFREYQRHRE